LESFLKSTTLSSEVWNSILEENQKDHSSKNYSELLTNPSDRDGIIKYLYFLISVDRKNSGLKEIQGYIWQKGYESGEIKSIIFNDAVDFFRELKSRNKSIVIYSSGSILAQKLIFQYSNFGDLTPMLSGYFDTTIGHKRESSSYLNILSKLETSSQNMVFFTDIVPEAVASKAVGIDSYILLRPGNAPQDTKDFPKISDFHSYLSK
jgi:enolase-phosphatase E1